MLCASYILMSNMSSACMFVSFQIVPPHQKGSSLGQTSYLHLASSVHPPRPGRLHQLRPLGTPSEPGLKCSPARTLARLWRPLCCSSSLSRTRKLEPLSAVRTRLPLWIVRPEDSPLHPGLQTRHLNLRLQLRPQQDRWLPLRPPQHSSQKTRTSALPTGLPADPLVRQTRVSWDASSKPHLKGEAEGHLQIMTHRTMSR